MSDQPPAPPPTPADPGPASGTTTEASWMPVWLKRLGLAGFLFFLAKGLLWLALPTLLVVFGGRC